MGNVSGKHPSHDTYVAARALTRRAEKERLEKIEYLGNDPKVMDDAVRQIVEKIQKNDSIREVFCPDGMHETVWEAVLKTQKARLQHLLEDTHVLSFTSHFIHVSRIHSSVRKIIAEIRRDVLEHAALGKSQFNFKRPDELDRFTHEIREEMHKELAPLRCEFFTHYVTVYWT